MTVLDMFRLDGKVALVTGGGRGLGLQMATALAEAGARVVVASRKLATCQDAADALQNRGLTVTPIAIDIADSQSIVEGVRETLSTFGQIDILVNNAGTSWGADALQMPEEAWDKVIHTNLTGTFRISQEVARDMQKKSSGSIINIASVAGLKGTDPEALDAVGYSASKGGVIALTRDLAVKWARHGIRVNAIAPGFFPTKMTKDLLTHHGQRIVDETPLRRLGGDRDLQGVALFFASDASAFVTGQVLAVDGGTSVR